jgi:hypothetical protein
MATPKPSPADYLACSLGNQGACARIAAWNEANGNPIGTGIKAGAGAVGIPTSNPITGIVDFLRRLSDPHLWLRVGEGILGIILIAAGLFAITKNMTPQSALARGFQSAGRKVF